MVSHFSTFWHKQIKVLPAPDNARPHPDIIPSMSPSGNSQEIYCPEFSDDDGFFKEDLLAAILWAMYPECPTVL